MKLPDQPPIVCGCDGVTYWNEAIAARFGVSVAQSGTCTASFALSCNDLGKACPDKRFCNKQTTANGVGICAVFTEGTCWGLPDSCPNLTGGKARPCGSSTDQCKTYCEAVKDEQPWFPDQDCKN
jgi:hypothetical protein